MFPPRMFPPDNLNQIESRESPYVAVSGTVDSAAKVLVDGSLAGQQGSHWSGEALLSNGSGPSRAAIPVKAAKIGTPDIKEISSYEAIIAEDPEDFVYDADGNLTSDGLYSYKWDAENRLVEMTSTLPTTAPFETQSKYDRYHLEFAYDYLGRRVWKKVTNSKDSSVTTHRYLYNGWNLVADYEEVSSAIGDLDRSYVWGLDIAGTLGATGGVGSLLQISVHAGSTVTDYFPGYDGNGNVTTLTKSDGTLAAAYEYGPFGEALRVQEIDSAIAGNPFRYSTKFTDVESGLLYYGYRYYSPSLGRFINRDPIEEQGGINLYSFVGNNGVNAYDYLGMDAFMTTYMTSDGEVHWVEGDGMDGDDWNQEARERMSRMNGVSPTGSTFAESQANWDNYVNYVTNVLPKFNALPPEVKDQVLSDLGIERGTSDSSTPASNSTGNTSGGSGLGQLLSKVPIVGGLLGGVGDLIAGTIGLVFTGIP